MTKYESLQHKARVLYLAALSCDNMAMRDVWLQHAETLLAKSRHMSIEEAGRYA